MSSFPILDLVVGVIFVFFLLSIICSSIVEMILTVRKARARILGTWLTTIFDTKVTNAKNQTVKLGQEIMDHCAVTALSKPGMPTAYIDAKNFVSALLDKVTTYSKTINPTSIEEMIDSLNTSTAISEELRRSFLIYAHEAKDTFDALTVKTIGAAELFRNKIENWYDSNMDRLTGTLKTKYTRRFTIWSAIFVCIFINADTIEISKYLYNNPEARAKIAAEAYKTGTDDLIKNQMQLLAQKTASADDTTRLTVQQLQTAVNEKLETINTAQAALNESIPLGWNKSEFSKHRELTGWIGFFLAKAIGIALTVIAVLMGTPFWFDVLNKISNLRGTGKRPETDAKGS